MSLLRNILELCNFVGNFSAPGLDEARAMFWISARRANLINRNIKCTQL